MTPPRSAASRSGPRVGLALSGGSFRGVAHIGVIKALEEAGMRPSLVAGTSAGSIIGAGYASGMDWSELADMARELFWPGLLVGARLERLCRERFASTFEELGIPLAVVATEVPGRRRVVITAGDLPSAVSASCAVRSRRRVAREGLRLKDGGFSCVLPAAPCRELGAELVIASDVWQQSAFLHGLGARPEHPWVGRLFSSHYRRAAEAATILIRPRISIASSLPAPGAVDRLIAEGESAARRALGEL